MSGHLRGPVVVGIDGSEEAKRAARYAAWEAQRRRVPVRLVHAHRPAAVWGPSVGFLDDGRAARQWIHDRLVEAEDVVDGAYPDLKVETTVVRAGAAAALVSESQAASLVVVATRAVGGVLGHLAGSVAAQVAAHSSAPVIVLRPAERDELAVGGDRPVLVGVDGSTESNHAIAFAVDEAVSRGCELHAVYVWNVIDIDDMKPIVPEEYVEANERAKAERLLAEAMAGWRERYPDMTLVERVIHDLEPVRAMVGVADDAGLIVVGSRGSGGFLNLRLGSTVDALIRCAPAPVAAVRGDYPERR